MATLQPALQLLETAFNANTRHMPPLSQMDDLKLSEFSAARPFPYISPVTGSAEGYSQFFCFTLGRLSWLLQQVELHIPGMVGEGGRFLKWSSASKSHRIQERATTDALHTAIIFQLNYRSTDMNTTAFLCSNST